MPSTTLYVSRAEGEGYFHRSAQLARKKGVSLSFLVETLLSLYLEGKPAGLHQRVDAIFKKRREVVLVAIPRYRRQAAGPHRRPVIGRKKPQFRKPIK